MLSTSQGVSAWAPKGPSRGPLGMAPPPDVLRRRSSYDEEGGQRQELICKECPECFVLREACGMDTNGNDLLQV